LIVEEAQQITTNEEMKPMFSFERLDVWQKASDFADMVYDGNYQLSIYQLF